MKRSELEKAFLLGCEHSGLNPGTEPIVVGLSGGCDSTVLGHLLVERGFNVIGVHINYRLRDEADADEQFVRDWTARNGVTLRVVHPTRPTPETGVQAWAREIRYEAFRRVALEFEANSIVIAHHADDQLETILMNLARGTGPAGVIGMRARREFAPGDACGVARPLLRIPRSNIEELAQAEDWVWVEDASNQREDYTRNALRMELSTLNGSERGAFRDAAVALSDRLAEMQDVILDGLRQLETDRRGHLPAAQLEEWPAWIKRWILTEWLNQRAPFLPRRRAITEEVLALNESQVGRKAVFEKATVWRERDGWYITTGGEYADSGVEAVSIRIPDEGGNTQYAVGAHMLDLSRLSITEAEKMLHFLRQQNERSILLMDLSSLSGPLQLRAWREGDRFQPLNLGGSKKVKSFLTDRKVRVSTRSTISVLTDENGILCVLGHAQDERSRITSETKDVLQLTWHASTMGND